MILPPHFAGALRSQSGSGRSVLLPRGLHGGIELFGPVVDRLGLVLEEYSLAPLGGKGDLSSRGGSGQGGPFAYLESLFEKRPLLFLTPTSVKINEGLLRQAAGRVAAFASVSTGTDHVDLEALEREGIPFLHAPGMNARSVAEYVVSSLPLLFPEERLLSGDLSVGIVGYGRIGRRLGLYLEKLGIGHRYYDPFVKAEEGAAPLEEVLGSDLVTFHVPLTKSGEHPTREMVQGEYLSLISGKSRVVNTSRGGIFTRESYLSCCRDHESVMDVFPVEPPGEELLHAARYTTPHVAGYNYEARAGGTRIVAVELARLLGVELPFPPLPPVRMDHDVIDFIPGESDRLKREPGSFSPRRENYPSRGSFADSLSHLQRPIAPAQGSSGTSGGSEGGTGAYSPFRQRALERLADLEGSSENPW